MSLVRLYIKEVSYSQSQRGAYVLIFNEAEGGKTLPVVVGAFEAQSIVIAMEDNLKSPRPLTHDLFKNFADKFDIKIKQVMIYKLVDGVFYANLICEQNGMEKQIDSRTSDAVALAIRFEAPIFIYKDILDEAGVYLNPKQEDELLEDFLDDEDEDDELSIIEELLEEDLFEEENKKGTPFSSYSKKELDEKLNEAIQNEDYELAAKIRDELNKRS